MSDIDRSATTLRVRADATEAERNLQRFQSAVGDLSSSIERLNGRLNNTAGTRRFNSNVRAQTREMSRFANTAKNGFGALAAFNTFTAATSGLLSGAFAFAVVNATNNLIKLGAQAESTRVRFLALSETISDGRRRYEEFADFADERGLEFRGLAEAANQLRVVGFAGEDLDRFIRQIGIVAGDSTERVQRITRALGQMRAFGRVALEELNQLTEAGVPIVTALAEELDVPEGRVRGLIELGRIDFDDVRRAFAALSAESSAFFEASEAQSETLQAAMNRLGNAVFMFADEWNERFGPSLTSLVEFSADSVEFFTTIEGAVVGFSTIIFAAAVPAIGALALIMANMIGTTIDPWIRRFQLMNVQLLRATRNAGRLRTVMIGLATATRAAFSGIALPFTIIAAVAIPAVIRQLELAREEAQKLADVLESVRAGDVVELDETSEEFDLVTQRIREIERELVGVNRLGEQYQEAWQNVTNQIREGEGDVEALKRTQESFNVTLTQTSNRAAELETELRELKTALGELEPFQPFVDVELPDEIRNKIIAETREVAQGINDEIEQRVEDLNRTLTFSPQFEADEIRRMVSFLENQLREVSRFAGEGLFFTPDHELVAEINDLLQVYNDRLEELRASSRNVQTPLDDLNDILLRNVEALRTVRSQTIAGLFDNAEAEQARLRANQDALVALISLYDRLNTTADFDDPELLNQIQETIDQFQLRIPESLGEEIIPTILGNITEEDASLDFSELFTDSERSFREGMLRFIDNIRDVQDIGPLFDLPSVTFTDEQLQEYDDFIGDTFRSWLPDRGELQSLFVNAAGEVENGFAQIIPVVDRGIAQYTENLDGVRAFGDLLGVHVTDQNRILVDLLQEQGNITEEEAFRLHDLLEEQYEAIEELSDNAETIDRALTSGFRIEVPPQVTAIANTILTIGEAAISIVPGVSLARSTIDGFLTSISTDFTGTIEETFQVAAQLISLVEQPAIAAAQAVIVTADNYEEILDRFVRLPRERREELLQSLGQFFDTRELRRIISDYEEVYSRIGGTIDADLFRVLPERIQEGLTDAFTRVQNAETPLRNFFDDIVRVFEEENLTVAERTRRFGATLARGLRENVIDHLDLVQNLVGSFDVSRGITSIDILIDLFGGLGDVLGVGADRAEVFAEALLRGTDSIILVERITESLNLSTLGVALGFVDLTSVINDYEGSVSRAFQASLRFSNAFRNVSLVDGDIIGDVNQFNEAIGQTTLGIEDLAASAASLAFTGGNITNLIAPGAGLLADQLLNVVSTATDLIAVRRTLNAIPLRVLEQDNATFLANIEAVKQFDQELNALLDAYGSLEAIPIDLIPPNQDEIEAIRADIEATLGALAPFGALIDSDIFREFAESRGIDLAKATIQDLSSLVDEFFEGAFDAAVQTAQAMLGAFRGLGDLIANQNQNAITQMNYDLEQFRDQRRQEEERIQESLDRELEGLRRQLDADLIALQDYYAQVDEAQAIARENIDLARQEEIRKENDIQQARWEGEVNAFNFRKVSALADIAINAAVAVTTALASIPPPFNAAVAAAVGAAALAQAAFVTAEQPPPRPPDIALQRGGVVDRPTYALIGEGGSPEAVIPLDRYEYRERGNSGDAPVIINVAGSLIRQEDLARFLRNNVGREQRRGRVRNFD